MATLLELASPALAGSGKCVLELEDAGGAKMTRVNRRGPQKTLWLRQRSCWRRRQRSCPGPRQWTAAEPRQGQGPLPTPACRLKSWRITAGYPWPSALCHTPRGTRNLGLLPSRGELRSSARSGPTPTLSFDMPMSGAPASLARGSRTGDGPTRRRLYANQETSFELLRDRPPRPLRRLRARSCSIGAEHFEACSVAGVNRCRARGRPRRHSSRARRRVAWAEHSSCVPSLVPTRPSVYHSMVGKDTRRGVW